MDTLQQISSTTLLKSYIQWLEKNKNQPITLNGVGKDILEIVKHILTNQPSILQPTKKEILNLITFNLSDNGSWNNKSIPSLTYLKYGITEKQMRDFYNEMETKYPLDENSTEEEIKSVIFEIYFNEYLNMVSWSQIHNIIPIFEKMVSEINETTEVKTTTIKSLLRYIGRVVNHKWMIERYTNELKQKLKNNE